VLTNAAHGIIQDRVEVGFAQKDRPPLADEIVPP
jgi:hypothetical protein